MNDALKKMLSGHKTWDGPLTAKIFHDLLIKRIEALDVESAKADIIRFVSNPDGPVNLVRRLFSGSGSENDLCIAGLNRSEVRTNPGHRYLGSPSGQTLPCPQGQKQL